MNTLAETQQPAEIYTVSGFNREARALVEGQFYQVWIEGELSNVARPSSGHMYFSLKDEQAQIRCAMFRGNNRHLDFTPKEGDQVLLRAKASIYEGRGDFQLIVERMELAGSGVLKQAFEKLKSKLANEGLFAEEHKRPLPELPKTIGIITSPTGAAVHDILTTLKRRFAAIPVIIYPSAVQGELAAKQLCDAIHTANTRQECDVLILARGGGSLEDLWPFNEEAVARAIFASEIPIVSGVGHEVDITIADFVADKRAATPTAAAELIVPNQQEWKQRLQQLSERITWQIESYIKNRQQHVDHLEKRLVSPKDKLQAQAQTLKMLTHQLTQQIKHQLQYHRATLQQASSTLDAISPLATLARGYAIAAKPDHTIIRQSSDCAVGDNIELRLGQGRLGCQVTKVVE